MDPVVYQSQNESGGHFAAWEKPEPICEGSTRDFGKGVVAHSVMKEKLGYRFLEMRSFINREKTVSRKGQSDTVSNMSRSPHLCPISNPPAPLLSYQQISLNMQARIVSIEALSLSRASMDSPSSES